MLYTYVWQHRGYFIFCSDLVTWQALNNFYSSATKSHVAQKPWTHHIFRDDIEFLILSPPSHKCWDYCVMLLCLDYAVLGIKPRTLYMVEKPSINWTILPTSSTTQFTQRPTYQFYFQIWLNCTDFRNVLSLEDKKTFKSISFLITMTVDWAYIPFASEFPWKFMVIESWLNNSSDYSKNHRRSPKAT